jgi:hypothetical protein
LNVDTVTAGLGDVGSDVRILPADLRRRVRLEVVKVVVKGVDIQEQAAASGELEPALIGDQIL